MNKKVVIGILVAAAALVAGFVFYTSPTRKAPDGQRVMSGSTGTPAPSDGREIMQRGADLAVEGESRYVPFTQAEYETAKANGNVIVLYFYADWCPICRAEEPEVASAFSELGDPSVVGFRVNFKDSETDQSEKALAQEFKVPYQHTKIILKNGREVARYPTQWSKQDALNSIRKELN